MKTPWKSISDEFNPKQNAFDFIRFVLASLVIFYHTYPLGGFGAGDPLQRFSINQEAFGGLAVAAFFALSGFLITRSGTGRVSIWRFFWHRFLRILPGFWVCLLFTAFIIAPIIWLAEGNRLNTFFQFTNDGPLRYLWVNWGLRIQQFSIHQLPTQTPFPHFINGSLWTLSHEFACYILIALLAVTGVLKKAPWLALLITLGLMALQVTNFMRPDMFATHIPPFSELGLFMRNAMYFFVGASLFLYAKHVPAHPLVFVGCVAIFIASLRLGFYSLTNGITVPYIFLWLALKLPITQWGRYGDFSYGIYIYGFPIQQILAALKVNQFGELPYFSLAFLVTLILAVLSYRFVEAPALRLKSLNLFRPSGTSKHPPTSSTITPTNNPY